MLSRILQGRIYLGANGGGTHHKGGGVNGVGLGGVKWKLNRGENGFQRGVATP